MVTDRQAKRLWQALSSGKTLAQAADKADMDEKTARKYRRLGRLPSEVAPAADVADTGRPVRRGLAGSASSNCKRLPAWRPRRCLRGCKRSTRGSSTTRSCAAFSVA